MTTTNRSDIATAVIAKIKMADGYISTEELFALAGELEEQRKQVKLLCMEWAEAYTHVQKVAKRFLSEDVVDGDSYAVPSIEDLVDMLAGLIGNRHIRIEPALVPPLKKEAKDEGRSVAGQAKPTYPESF